MCASCTVKDGQILILQTRIAILERHVKTLERKIESARVEAGLIDAAAAQKMSGHCPRGVWAHCKGERTAASRIDSCLM